MSDITFNVNLLSAWLTVRIAISILLIGWELQNNKFSPSQVSRRILFHLCFNPEWGIIKGLMAIPAYAIYGNQFGSTFFYRFLPIKLNISSPNCPVCYDTGIVRSGRFDKGRQCSCRISTEWLDSYKRDMEKWRVK